MVKDLVYKTIANGVGLWLATRLVPGIHVGPSTVPAGASTWPYVLRTLLLVALIFGIVHAVVKPVAKFLSMPVILLTLGLFTLVINAGMLQLTSWLSGRVGLDFNVSSFLWDAVLGALVVTAVSILLGFFNPAQRR